VSKLHHQPKQKLVA